MFFKTNLYKRKRVRETERQRYRERAKEMERVVTEPFVLKKPKQRK